MRTSQPIELQSRTIQGHAEGKHLLITGGVHGDEFEPMAAIRTLMERVDAAALRGRLTLVPCVNEAAFARLHRTAEDGLDLARVCPGSADGSITMRTAHALAALIHDADAYIDLHTGGTTLDIVPLSGYALHQDAAILDTQRRMARAFNLPLIWGTSPNLDGRSLSVARDANVPAIYTEWGGAACCRPEAVDGYVEGCLNVMGELDMIDRPTPASRVEHVVEDRADGSGHLQVQNPTPMDGFFDPAVALGEHVEQGQALGTVCDHLGDHVETIAASNRGIVIMLKTFPRVAKGEAVAAIVDVGKEK